MIWNHVTFDLKTIIYYHHLDLIATSQLIANLIL